MLPQTSRRQINQFEISTWSFYSMRFQKTLNTVGTKGGNTATKALLKNETLKSKVKPIFSCCESCLIRRQVLCLQLRPLCPIFSSIISLVVYFSDVCKHVFFVRPNSPQDPLICYRLDLDCLRTQACHSHIQCC